MTAREVEMWEEIGDSGYYVSNHGNVNHLIIGEENPLKPITPEITQKGYRCIRIRGKRYRVHRLVAQTFIPNPHGYKYVHHVDGDMSNNKASNLEWVEHCPKRNT